MLSVKLVRSIVLGETITTHHHHHHNDIHLDDHHHHHHHDHHDDHTMMMMEKKKKKMPMLLFTPTKELISDTFRLATIARDLGMEFLPSSSLSHLLFSWPPPSPPPYPPPPPPSSSSSNHRTSVSSQTSTFTHTSSSSAATTAALRNDGVPIPFPTLSTNSSISLLRSFVSLSKGLFKLVFIDLSTNPNPDFAPSFFNYYHDLVNYDAPLQVSLFSRVSGKQVKSIDDLSGELAAKGWSLFRTPVKRVSPENSVYLFRKTDPNRVRVKIDGVGECSRVRELRLPAIDFEKGMNLRVLLYILLMTDDVFYLA